MDPFDPDAEFEELVLALNDEHRPGSIIAGKTRNALVRAWALFAGRERALSELQEAIARHGSKAALARSLTMTRETLDKFERHFSSVRQVDPRGRRDNSPSSAFRRLSAHDQVEAARLASELLSKPELLQLLRSTQGPETTRLLQTALRAAELRHAVGQLRSLLDGGHTSERLYQDWCDEHSWVFGGAHQTRDAVRRIDEGSITDLLLPDVVGYRDIVELKRPDAGVLGYDSSHQTHYLSADVSRAIGQVHKYMDRLHDLARKGLPAHPHIVSYHPRATIVIGRSQNWSTAKTEALRGLNQRLHGIDVITYDHLLARAEAILANIEPTASNSQVQTAPTSPSD
jgi:hypothetical protein